MISRFYQSFRRRSVARWLLPSLLARVLIPLGFMPGNLLAGELVVPCPSAMPASVFETGGHAHHHGHHMGHGDGSGNESPDLLGAERQCPIGLALSAAATIAPELQPETLLPRVAGIIQSNTASHCSPRTLHYHSRAPPRLAVS